MSEVHLYEKVNHTIRRGAEGCVRHASGFRVWGLGSMVQSSGVRVLQPRKIAGLDIQPSQPLSNQSCQNRRSLSLDRG